MINRKLAVAFLIAGLSLSSCKNDICLEGKKVVCIITGTGLKDAGFASKVIGNDIEVCSPDISGLERMMCV